MASPAVERLLDDDVIHEQLADAAKHLREAVGGVAAALRRVEQPPKTHRVRTLVLALAAGGGAAAVASKLSR